MIDSPFGAVRHLDLFARMSDESFLRLTRAAYLQSFPAQLQLIAEGDPADFLHVLVSGRVELFSTWNGRETSMATVHPVSTFILAATVRDAPYLMSARTVEKSRLILIPSQDVREIFEQDIGFAKAIVNELARCYRATIRTSKNLKLRNSQERLANYLLRQLGKSGNRTRFELLAEKRRVASYLGMTPENLSRAFNALKAHGVEVDGSHVTIVDHDKLVAFACPHALLDDYAN
ncbi:MAG: cyclic nucleotide-binding domain-containing protein [Rhodobacter sp.]|nr:cyclic nucleotide-binding domain-containing protein [Paracoccaceae bacterium]MCB1409413.1 cyclic nucleotide-binding domain-containing protein [Paracoccaceae bacterium]MCC0080399.1 cyclic nucleotide-binding domain-containing protein [Rhodobacter sp.]